MSFVRNEKSMHLCAASVSRVETDLVDTNAFNWMWPTDKEIDDLQREITQNRGWIIKERIEPGTWHPAYKTNHKI